MDEKLKAAFSEFDEARSDYESYLANPYTVGSDEDIDCMFERLLELADKSRALVDLLRGQA